MAGSGKAAAATRARRQVVQAFRPVGDPRGGCAARWPHRCSPESRAPLATARHPRRLFACFSDVQTWQAPALLVRSPRITLKRSRRGSLAARAFQGSKRRLAPRRPASGTAAARSKLSISVVSAFRRTLGRSTKVRKICVLLARESSTGFVSILGSSGDMVMAKRSASLGRARRIARKSLAMSESRIDYSDIPPISKEQLRSMKRVGKRALKLSQLVRVIRLI